MAWVFENWEAILGSVAVAVPAAVALCIKAANRSVSLKDDMFCAKVARVWSAFISILPSLESEKKGNNPHTGNR